MAIWYDYMREGWVDEDDPEFFISMTPEGGVYPDMYENRDDFYKDFYNT